VTWEGVRVLALAGVRAQPNGGDADAGRPDNPHHDWSSEFR
jgi:hypothetical protein